MPTPAEILAELRIVRSDLAERLGGLDSAIKTLASLWCVDETVAGPTDVPALKNSAKRSHHKKSAVEVDKRRYARPPQPNEPGTGKTQTLILDALKGMGAVPTVELWEELKDRVVSHAAVATCLTNLKDKGLVQRLESGSWMITQAGADLVP